MKTAEDLHRDAERRMEAAERQQADAEQTLARLGYDERRRRTHALCQIGALVSSALDMPPVDIDPSALAAALNSLVPGRRQSLGAYLRQAYDIEMW